MKAKYGEVLDERGRDYLERMQIKSQVECPVGESSGDGLYQITVEDNGIGFDERYLDRIFQVLERLHGRGEKIGGIVRGQTLIPSETRSQTHQDVTGIGSVPARQGGTDLPGKSAVRFVPNYPIVAGASDLRKP